MRIRPTYLIAIAMTVAAIVTGDKWLPLTPAVSAKHRPESLEPIREIKSYEDADFSFSLAVPANWTRIIADEPESELDELETVYAVGFESPRTSEGDQFADYIMIEIIPGSESGAFETGGEHTKTIVIDGHPAQKDELSLTDFQVADRKLDLQVYQAELVRLGYTVGFYAIGEHREAKVLRDAFRLMIETFKLPPQPFDLS